MKVFIKVICLLLFAEKSYSWLKFRKNAKNAKMDKVGFELGTLRLQGQRSTNELQKLI